MRGDITCLHAKKDDVGKREKTMSQKRHGTTPDKVPEEKRRDSIKMYRLAVRSSHGMQYSTGTEQSHCNNCAWCQAGARLAEGITLYVI